MSDWTAAPGHAIAAAIRAGEVCAREVTAQHLAAIRAGNGTLNAFTDVTEASAFAQAEAIDARRARGEKLPPLAGVPFSAKNLFDIAGLVTRAGAKINRDNPPANQDAVAIRRLKQAGAILLGAVNMGEYAYDFTGRNAHDGDARNPLDPARMTGGSSSGSGGAVAARFCPISIGSDTNGSIRVPASLCGIFGFKPTYGALSRHGSFPFVASLDHIGPLARSVRDLALAYEAMRGPDRGDAACWGGRPVLPALELGRAGLRIGVATGYFAQQQRQEAQAAIRHIAAAIGDVAPVDWPEAARARAAAYIITMVEGAALHATRLRTRPHDFDPEVRDRLLAGLMLPGSWYVAAQQFRRWYRAAVLPIFERFDVVLAPATPCSAPLIEAKTFTLDGVELPVRANLGLFTQPISFIGLPAVSVPVNLPGALPIGVQIIAAPGRDDQALAFAHWLEASGVVSPAGAKTETIA